jgi:2-deoxy-D-gluconate 3-dehydrogenase
MVAIVTGATRGLGRAILDAFVGEGMRVLAAARTTADLAALENEHGAAVATIECDMKDRQSVRTLVPAALGSFGRLDVVVNNAGIGEAGRRFLDLGDDLWDEIIAVNLTGCAALARDSAEHFVRQRSGRIINIASIGGLRGKVGRPAYGPSKAALIQLTRGLAVELAPYGVQANAIAPGAIATPIQGALLTDDELMRRRVAKIPAKRMGRPEEMGPLACYLASPLSGFVTGAVFVIDGGESIVI